MEVELKRSFGYGDYVRFMRFDSGALWPVFLLGFFLVVVTSLGEALRLIDMSKIQGTSPVVEPSPPTSGGFSRFPGVSEQLSYSWIVVTVGVVLFFALLALAKRRRLLGDDSLLWRVVGALLGVAIYPALLLLARVIPLQSSGLQQYLMLATITVAIAALVVAASVMVFLSLYERSKSFHLSASLRDEHPLRSVRRLIASMKETIYSVRGRETYRDSIIACYSAMTKLLAGYGAPDKRSFTPRELRTSAGRLLGISGSEIDDMTRLFEKARYGEVPPSRLEAQRSVEALERITDELQSRIGSSGRQVAIA